jgi:aldehyde:ferredoxin oxidoreductase
VNLPRSRDKAKFEALKDRYHELRGWDVKTGWPTRAKLEELGLNDVADELASIGKPS